MFLFSCVLYYACCLYLSIVSKTSSRAFRNIGELETLQPCATNLLHLIRESKPPIILLASEHVSWVMSIGLMRFRSPCCQLQTCICLCKQSVCLLSSSFLNRFCCVNRSLPICSPFLHCCYVEIVNVINC